ncbi:MAG: ribonuclease HII [Chitinophagales bacterium]|nr:ribonuclease HII [Chitinophagales bacterium]
MLLPYFQNELIEAGCDEAGRGCLAGPVFAAAVIFPKDYTNKTLNDSKQIAEKMRYALRESIEKDAIAFAVAQISAEEIDRINILNASIKAMHLSLDQLNKKFQLIIVDGNKFKPYKNLPYQTIVKGDGKYLSIAAASILAKTYRDDFMTAAHNNYPQYDWLNNKGYGTLKHRQAMIAHGTTPLHRKSFHLKEQQLKIF